MALPSHELENVKESVGVVGGRGIVIRSQRQDQVGVEIHDCNASCKFFAEGQLVKHKKNLPMPTTVYPFILRAALSRTLCLK